MSCASSFVPTKTTTTITMSVEQPLAAPRSSSYMLMLNSFASDLDSILSDLSTSPTPQCRSSSHEVNRLASGLDVTTSATNDSHAASCPNLAAAFAAPTHPPPPPPPLPSLSFQSQSRDSVVISSSSTSSSAIAVTTAKTNKITPLADVVDSAAASSSPLAPPTPHRLQSSSEDATDSPSSEISLLERLIRSHPVWYLPNLQRVAAAQLLHNQEQGVFITRQSSQPGTLALSVKLTPQSSLVVGEASNRQSNGALIGAGVQHYLIEAADNQQGVRLESSDFVFDNLPSLLAHYCQCCDELPVRLRLPAKIRQCSTRQNLTAIALLGQEFWSTGDNILTIPSKKTPPVPPLRLSTFDPFNTLTSASGSTPNTPTTAALEPVLPPQPPPPPNGPTVERNKSHSPRLEARGTEPTPPPPPPRWCKPPLVPTTPVTLSPNAVTTTVNVNTDSKGQFERMKEEEEENGSEDSVEQQQPPPTPVIHVQVVADEPGPVFQKKQQQPARRPLMQQRRRRPRRRRSSPSGQSPHCHHSSLADKASDYEDIWGTSPGGSHDEDDVVVVSGGGVSAQALAPKPLLAALLANQEDTALSDRTAESYRSTSSSDRNSSSNRSSTSSLDKATSVSSTRSHRGNSSKAAGSSRSVSTSPEPPMLRLIPTCESNREQEKADVEEDVHIEPPLLFQQPRLSTVTGSVTVVQIGDSTCSPTAMQSVMDDNLDVAVTNEVERNADSIDKIVEPTILNNGAPPPVEHNVENNKENLPSTDTTAVTASLDEEFTAPTVRRRTSCSSAESSKNNSRRTSPLYSEPADALPPQLAAQYWIKNQQNRPLPMPPFSSASSEFTTFTKDGYVRCTLPTLTQSTPQNSQSNAKTSSAVLSSSTPSSSQSAVSKQRPATAPFSGVTNNKSKQVVMPKPPRQLPPSGPSSVETQQHNNKVFPSLIYLPTVNEDNSLTIQEVLTALYPSAAISNSPSRTPTPPNASSRSGAVTPIHHHVHLPLTKQRMSAYDNLLAGSAGDLEEADREQLDDNNGDDSSDDGTVTEFSEPWDSTRWDQLLSSPSGSLRCGSSNTGRRKRAALLPQHADTLNTATSMSSDGGIGTLSDFETLKRSPDSAASSSRRGAGGTDAKTTVVTARPPPIPPLLRTRSFKDKMDPLLASPRLLALRSTCNSQAGKNLQVLVVQLGRDCTTTFGRSLQNFLQCTREAKEQRAAAVLRNVRQFISGIKNFLVQHGEPAFDSALLEIRSKLKSNEFLNVDVVLELVLHQLVTLPLRSHLYKLLGQEALAAGSVQQLVAGIRVAREVPPSSLGLKEGQPPPSADVLQRASASLERLQRAASPLDKLEQLLDACAIVYNHAAEACGEAVAAEDFLPLLAWLLAHCGFTTAEMEADFMWAMLQPSLLAGEGGYFLTALSSAAQLLKNLQSRPASPSDCGSSWMGTLTSIPECAGQSSSTSGIQQPCVLRVLVADENQSSLLARTVPLRPSMTVRDITKLLALKLRLSNPQDFTLVALIDGQEIQLPETENPQTWIMSNAAAAATASSTSSSSSSSTTNSVNGGSTERNCTFAFRRQDAKIAWPRQING